MALNTTATNDRAAYRESFARYLAVYVLVGCIAFAAFAFGAVEWWAREWLRFGTLVCLALLVWGRGLRGVFPRTAIYLAVPAAAMMLLAVVQVVPLPRAALEVVSPSTSALYDLTVPDRQNGSLEGWLLQRGRDQGIEIDVSVAPPDLPIVEGAGWEGRTLSVFPHGTVRAALNWLTATLLFLAAAGLSHDRFLRYRLLWGIAIVSAALGAVATAQKISWNGLILWFRDRPPGSRPLGPYVNPNHFSGFVELGALVAMGLGLALFAQFGDRLEWATIRAAIADRGWTLPRLLLAGACGTLSVAGVLLSGSRGGFLAFACGLVFLFLGKRTRALLVLVVAAVAVLGAAAGLVNWIGIDAASDQGVPFVLSKVDPSGFMRLSAWGSTLRIFADYPVAGTGLGTFRWIFPAYQERGEWKEWNQAHNEYVQLLAETGVAGAVIFLWGLIVFLRSILAPSLRTAARAPGWTTVAVGAAVFAMLVHNVVEFNLQVPANAGLFAVLLGVLAAAAEDQHGTRSWRKESA